MQKYLVKIIFMQKKLFGLVLIPFLIASCIPTIQKISLPEPQVKTEIKVSITEIRNISTNTNFNMGTIMDIIKQSGVSIDFSEYDEETTNHDTNYQATNIQEGLITNSEILQQNLEHNTNLQDQTNILALTNNQESNIFDNLTNITNIDIDNIIKRSLNRNLKAFLRTLGKYNYTEDEIKIQNIEKIEEEMIKQYTNISLKKYLLTNYITNIVFETNYYISENNSNKVNIEVVKKEYALTELKISNEFLWDYVVSNNSWILKVTNGVPFVEGTPADFSINVFYDFQGKSLGKLSTNLSISLFVVVSNNNNSNYIIFKTNMDIIDFLSSDHKIFKNLKHFFYNYRSGIFVADIYPNEYDIYIDGIYLGRGKTEPEIVSEGLHKVTLSRGSFVMNEYVFIEKGKVNIYKKDLSERSKNVAIVNIDSLPSGALLFLDNQYIGTTPTNLVIPEGNYRIWLKKNNLEKFSSLYINEGTTNLFFPLEDLNDKTGYNIMNGITLLFGTATISSIFLYFWADSQWRYYDFLSQKESKSEYLQMREYYYYFRDNMRTTAIVGTVGTFILWGVTLGIESDKFFIKLNSRF